MARLPRLLLPGQPHHLMLRGNNRQPIVHADADRQQVLEFLRDGARQYRVAIHAYALMDNHLHLVATPEDEQGISKMMQSLGRRYVAWFNHKYGRTGTLWEGRFRATVIDSERYFLACMRYVELNPVRAGLCALPEDFPWSSCASHLGRRSDALLSEHLLYWTLGNKPFEREMAYRELLMEGCTEAERLSITQATLKGWPLGSSGFLRALADQTQRRVQPQARGRPRKLDGTSETSAPSTISKTHSDPI